MGFVRLKDPVSVKHQKALGEMESILCCSYVPALLLMDFRNGFQIIPSIAFMTCSLCVRLLSFPIGIINATHSSSVFFLYYSVNVAMLSGSLPCSIHRGNVLGFSECPSRSLLLLKMECLWLEKLHSCLTPYCRNDVLLHIPRAQKTIEVTHIFHTSLAKGPSS